MPLAYVPPDAPTTNRRKHMKRFVVVLGLVFALVGLTVGTNHLSVTQNGETANCAGPFGKGTVDGADAASKDQMNELAGKHTTFEAACEGKKETYKILSGIAVILGVGLFIGGLAIPRKRTVQQ